MSDLLGRSSEVQRFYRPRWECGKILRFAAALSLLAAVWMSISPMTGTVWAATVPASEFVVPGGPMITLQDGQKIEGHIVGFDQTNVTIRSNDGAEQKLPRATIDQLMFTTVTGREVFGALIGWKPGVYELTSDEAIVTVYSVAPPVRLDNERVNARVDKDAAIDAEPDAEPVVARGLNGTDKVEDETAGGTGGQGPAAEPISDLEISVSVSNARENGEAIGFDIELSRPSESSVVLIYATIDGTAIEGKDYQAARGVLVIKAGQTSARIEALVIDDDESEDEEQLQLFLTVDPAVAVVKDRKIIATIQDDDQRS